MEDWRESSQNLEFLMQRFFSSQDFSASTDVTFQLPDGSEMKAHKIILGFSSEVFYSQFFGQLADKTVEKVKVTDDFDSDAFRRMIKSIYSSGKVPDLEINDYLDLLKAANFYLLQEVIDECNERLCEHVKSLEIQELIDWTHMVSQLSIHGQVYESCREAILSKLSSIIKENKWDCIPLEVRNKLVADLEDTEKWKGDAYLILKVLKRLCSLEIDSLFPERIKKFNSDMESFFESVEKYHEFIPKVFEKQIQLDDIFDHPNMYLQYQALKEKLKNYLNSIETKDKVLSDMYSFIKGEGLNLDVYEFMWEEQEHQHYFRELEEDAVEWESQKDREHYWRLLEFSKLHQLDNLRDHCHLKLYSVMLQSYPGKLAFHINRASATPGAEELFKLGIHVFVNNTVSWRWLKEPYVGSFGNVPEEIKLDIMRIWIEASRSFNEEAIKNISDQREVFASHGTQGIRLAIQSWCEAHSPNAEEASNKFEMVWRVVCDLVPCKLI